MTNAFKYFIGYQEGEIVKPLYIILPQISGYINYFENGGKNMSFMIKDVSVVNKCNKMWDKIKEKLRIKFHSMTVYDQMYIKAKVRELDDVMNTNFLGDEIPKENMHYTCIDLEECKYKVKEMQMSRFISADLESNSDSELDLEAESKSGTELMSKLKF